MTSVVVVLVLAAGPDLQGARVCMAVAELQNKACTDLVEGFVPADVRTEARRRCSAAFHRGLEACLVQNGVQVTQAQRRLWQRLDDSFDALAACYGRVQNDSAWCASRAGEGDLGACRTAAERGLSQCEAEHRQRQTERDAERRAAEAAEREAAEPGKAGSAPAPVDAPAPASENPRPHGG